MFAARAITEQPARLTFRLTGESPDQVLSQDGFRRIGPGKSGNVYAVGGRLGGDDERAAALAKGAVIAAHATAQDWRSAVSLARETALRSLEARGSASKELLAYLVAHDTAGFGPFSVLLEDSANIEEIVVNRPTSGISVYHSKFGLCTTNLAFESEGSMRLMLNKLIADAEKELNADTPIIDAQVEGSRVHAQLRPYAVNGAAVSIRLNSASKVDLRRMVESGTIGTDALAYLWMALEAGLNIVISGAPASGKTSLMLSLAALLPRHERVVIIEEDASELMLGSAFANAVNLQGRKGSKADLQAQVINALHIRPDRIVIGELRGAEARDAFSAGNLGVPFMTTMHSDCDGDGLVRRLTARPMCVEPDSISALDVAVFMGREGQERRVRRICEYRWATRGDIDIGKVGGSPYAVSDVLDRGMDAELLKGSKAIARFAERNVIPVQRAVAEFRKRARFLSKMTDTDEKVRDYIGSYGA